MSKRISLTSLFVLLTLLLAACAQPTAAPTQPAPTPAPPTQAEPTQAPPTEAPPTEAPPTEPPTEEPLVIGAILFSRDSFFENIQAGMEQAAEEEGVELLVSIHQTDVTQETQYIEDYVARGVDAIVITPTSVDASVAAVREANEAGVLIVCFNTCLNQEATEELVPAFYETDQVSLGYETGEYLAQWIADQGITEVNLGVLSADKFEAGKKRYDGMIQALNDAGLEFAEVANQEGYLADEASAVAETMLQAHPEINVLWAVNEGGTVGAVVGVRTMAMQGQVFVFGTDISPQLAEMLLDEENILQATTGQNPRQMGGDAIREAAAILRGAEPTGYNVVANAFYSRDDLDAVEAYLAEN